MIPTFFLVMVDCRSLNKYSHTLASTEAWTYHLPLGYSLADKLIPAWGAEYISRLFLIFPYLHKFKIILNVSVLAEYSSLNFADAKSSTPEIHNDEDHKISVTSEYEDTIFSKYETKSF